MFVELDPAREAEMVRLNVEAVVALCGGVRTGDDAARPWRGAERGLDDRLPAGADRCDVSSSKAFVLSFSEALHMELQPEGVTVTALTPGPVRTEFIEGEGLEQRTASCPDRCGSTRRRSPRPAFAGSSAVSGSWSRD
jgi:short-subunit dehydrogenase